MRPNFLWLAAGFLAGAVTGALGFVFFAGGVENVSRIAFTDPTGSVLPFSDATTTYQNSTYGFSLLFPAELAVDEYDEGSGDRTIIFRKGEENVGFQVFITPYEGTLSVSDLQRLAPSLRIENPVEATVGTGTPALAFESTAPGVGPSRELWFVHQGHLFQVTTYPELGSWLASIMQSWNPAHAR